jgi:alkaline phosphatase
MLYEIATDLPKAAFDFYAGAGFLQEKNKKDTTLASVYEIIKDSGYVVVRGLKEYEAKSKDAEKIVFVQEHGSSANSLSYAISRKEGDLTLTQITRKAIDFLSQKEQEGFFLMVEGGKIDWACHSNDAATVFHEIIDFSAAIQEALNFYQKHPDETLIVVTADHETGGMALGNGPYALNLKVLQFQQMSIEKLTTEIKELRKAKNNQVVWEDIESLLAKTVGFGSQVKLTEKQLQKLKETYKSSFIGDQVVLEKNLYASNEPVAGQAIRILSEIAGIAWASGGHSAGLVPVYAIGAGASLFQGKLDNTDIPRKIAEAAGY